MRKLLLLVALTLPFASFVHAQGAAFERMVFTNTGRPVAGAKITLCIHSPTSPNPCTNLATIYRNVELTGGPIANPTVTDGYGNVLTFLSAFGTYDYSVSGNGIATTTYRGITLNNGTGGTVTSVGGLTPLFTVTNPLSSPVFVLSSAAANTVFANCTVALAAPNFCSITGAMLPFPSATTLGGIQSFAASPNQWINAISTSGVPSATQPAFTNISGTLPINRLVPGSNTQCVVTIAGVPTWSACASGTVNFLIQFASVAGCTTAAPPASVCGNTVTWPVAFADASYTAVCSGVSSYTVPQSGGAFGVAGVADVRSYLAASVQVVTTNLNEGNIAAAFTTINCIGIHP